MLGAKIRRLIELKRDPDTLQPYPLSVIAAEASRLYRERQIHRKVQELRDAHAIEQAIERVVEQIQQEKDVLTRPYLSGLVNDKRTNPTYNVIEALSLFFQVSPAYFFVGADATEATRAAEAEVELIELVVGAQKLLDSATESNGSKTEGARLIGALFRGTQDKDPEQVEMILKVAVQALKGAPDSRTR
ncbi:hypothetical protein AB0E08_07770 [Streptomyces sp. NPDC048281]|uniref:hypothetical protein n=1 Tax=Streptomyces sp. NPDC048281 TaxID=3154715 RepID=UPI003447F90F